MGGGFRSDGGGGRSWASPGRSFAGSRSGSGTQSHAYRSGKVDRHHHHFRHRRSVVVGPYFYDGYGYGSCSYYYRRALATGSGYWWRRYYDCTGG